MPMPKVVIPLKLWDEDEIHYWIEARQDTRNHLRPRLNMKPCHSRQYPAAARRLAQLVGLPTPEGIKREFSAEHDENEDTITVHLTTRHTMTVDEYQTVLMESQK